MTAWNRGETPAIPFDEIRTSRPVAWRHAHALARGANELDLGGGLVFFNPCHLTLTSGEGGGYITTGTFRHKVPVRRNITHRMWVVNYRNNTLAGIVKITPTIAPVNAADAQWATGKPTEPSRDTTATRTPAPLVFFEEVTIGGGGGYTVPDSDHALSYTITWDPDTGGEDITILSIACYEIDRAFLESGSYGVHEHLFRPRAAIFSGASNAIAQGVRQLAAIIDRVKTESLHRYLFGVAFPDDDIAYLASSSSHVATDVFVVSPRFQPSRYARTNPGFATGPIIARAYGRNSATTGGSVFAETSQSSVELTGFPIGSYGWVEDDVTATLQAFGKRSAPTTTGFQTGAAATDDEPSEENMTSEETAAVTIRGKVNSGDAANTLDIISFELVQVLT